MAVFDTTRLVEQVLLKGSLPTGNYTDQEILDVAYDALQSEVVPLIIALREEFFCRNEDYAITAAKAAYPIPSRASGLTLRDIKKVKGEEVIPLYQIDRSNIVTTSSGTPERFYKEENNVILYPTPDVTADTLRMTYFIRPSVLVPTSECGTISTIDTATKTITGTFPSTWTTANTLDLIKASPGFENRAIDLVITSVSTSSITFSATLPTTLAVGDYVSLAGESCFPQIPQEAQQLLVQLTVAACLEAEGDQQGFQTATSKIEKLTQNLRMLLQDRVQGAPIRFRSQLRRK